MLAAAAAAAVVLAAASPAQAGDRALLEAVREYVPRVQAAAVRAAGGRGGPTAAQAQYDTARRLEERLRAAKPVSAACRPLLNTALAYAGGRRLEMEGVDRPSSAIILRGAGRAADAERRLPGARGTCLPAPARGQRPRELDDPVSNAVFFGDVRVRAPAGADLALVVVNGRGLGTVRIVGGRVALRLDRPPGRYSISVRFFRAGRLVGVATSRSAWLLDRRANRAVPPRAPDRALRAELRALAASFGSYAGIWAHDLATGRTADWAADARFPAASTVKIGVLVASLRRFRGAAREPVGYDLETLTSWSSNLASNRLVALIGGGSETRGTAAVQSVLRELGAATSTFTGFYTVGTPFLRSWQQPPLVSSRVTTARDLGRLLFTIHAAALGSRVDLRRLRLSRADARLVLGLLLSSQAVGDNVGLFRPSLGPRYLLAQKNGWISTARHTAAILYTPTGPKIVVLLTYRGRGLRLSEGQTLGRRLLRAVGY